MTLCLKHKKQHYTILDKKPRAKCWSIFGVSAKILGKDKYEIIKNFASCKTCYQTYSYSSTTTMLTNHKCTILTSKNQSTLENFRVSRSTSTKPMFSSTKLIMQKIIKFLKKQKSLFTTSLSDWICSNVRPIAIVEDSGLKDIIDQCIQIGRACEFSTYMLFTSIL